MAMPSGAKTILAEAPCQWQIGNEAINICIETNYIKYDNLLDKHRHQQQCVVVFWHRQTKDVRMRPFEAPHRSRHI